MPDITVDRMNIYRTCTAFSHSLGNLTAIIEKYIKDQFSTDYFKKTFSTTEAGFISIGKLGSKNYTFERPAMVIDPRFLSDQESDALPQINWGKFNSIDANKNEDLVMMNGEFFIKSIEPQFSLGYSFNRYKFNFGITMIVDTQMMRMSLVNYLRTTFRFKHPYPIDRYVESMIPRPYMQHMADTLNLDINSEEFLAAINKVSEYPVLRLFRPATGLTEFFALIETAIQLRIPDYPSEDTIRIGRIENYSQVKFDMEVELNLISSFMLATPEVVTIPNGTDLTSQYSVKIAIDGRVPIPDPFLDNKILYTRILVEAENPTETLDLTAWLNTEINKVRNYVKTHSISTPFMAVKVYSMLNILDLSVPTNGSIDYDTMILTLNNLNKESIYTILIYTDQNFIKSIVEAIQSESLPHTPGEYNN